MARGVRIRKHECNLGRVRMRKHECNLGRAVQE